MASATTTSLSLRLFTTKLPIPLRPSKPPSLLSSLSSAKSISFERIATTLSPPCSSSSSPSSSAQLQPIEDLPPNLQSIVTLFQSVPDPKSKYQQLLFYGKNLKPLDPAFKTRENKVEGCVSQVWVRAYLDSDRNVVFEADSDSVLTKGLAALLVQGLSGRPADEILQVSPDFVTLLGLQQSLTPSRNNGFLNMLKLMQKKALLLAAGAESNGNGKVPAGEAQDVGIGMNSGMGVNSSSVSESDVDGGREVSAEKLNLEVDETDGEPSLGSRGQRIREKLEKELSPIELHVEDVSYQHAGHAGSRGSDGETHFNLRVVSKEFEGKSLVKRHRLVYDLLQEELQSGLHALSIVAKTPAES
ncbi:sufE-like protein 1, chloroplastic/mitochondrial isoform X1 [Rhodamnia argentea]|uniref:SufE-like protein 1, chloroplastic/mitochondrial isoform X1 n=1 Tax=Rhodamnia argentea TaxID=178133 RepID=A0A8B8QR80_9MYRT|nr:sufE-like protein 1, chloroplastic/mitochondrial isoform X1 [Rhodamnia argentea]